MGTVRTSRVSEAEFLALPESLDKIEFVDGEVVVTPAPNHLHQLVLQRIVRALSDWAEKQERDVTIGQAPLDIRFGPDRILQPDAFVIFDDLDATRPPPLDRVPEICVEVLSTNRVHDRVTKKLLYAQAGVQEYWAVDTAGVVEQWTGPGLSQPHDFDVQLTSALLPGFAILLEDLLRPRSSLRRRPKRKA